MYLNIVSALRLPNEAISGTPQIAGPNAFRQTEEVHSSNNAKCLHSLPTSLRHCGLDKVSGGFWKADKTMRFAHMDKKRSLRPVYMETM